MKVILIVDLVDEYDLNDLSIDYKVKENGNTIFVDKNASLINVPKKREVDFMEYWYKQGWNACIDEILGETE